MRTPNLEDADMRRYALALKIATLAVLSLLLIIAIASIAGLVDERQSWAASVRDDIARTAYGPQTLVGPVLIVPWERVTTLPARGTDEARTSRESGQVIVTPQMFEISAMLESDTRSRGIYDARLYNGDVSGTARFRIPPRFGLAESSEPYRFGPASLVLSVSDVRGIKRLDAAKVNNRNVDWEPGTQTWMHGGGTLMANVGTLAPGAELAVELSLRIGGMEQLSIVPVGDESRVDIESAWPHPAFVGQFLPEERSVTDEGFTARWMTTRFSTDVAGRLLKGCDQGWNCAELPTLGVALIQPVDVYQQTERAIKYAILFIGLTFAAFFLLEVIKGLAIHPMQYLLVGSALAMFFLLLLSLAEHIDFAAAYAVAAIACVVLIAVYLQAVLGSVSGAVLSGALLGGLYGLLFLVLRSEDYALLMGSSLVFAVLGVAMLLTRRVDWYRVGERLPAAVAAD